MGRVKITNKEKGKYPYYVEMRPTNKSEWKAEVRYYEVKQDVKDFPDNELRRNFKYLEKE